LPPKNFWKKSATSLTRVSGTTPLLSLQVRRTSDHCGLQDERSSTAPL
jgi:hypothetical protein